MENKELQLALEEYVTKMAKQMKQEFYLEDLKKIYIAYQECLKGMQEHSKKLSDSAILMKEQRIAATVDLKALKSELEESANRVEKAMDTFYQGYGELLEQYEEKIVFLNEKERENYNRQFQEILTNTYQNEKKGIEVTFEKWKKDLENLSENIVSEESLLRLKEQLEQIGEIVQNTNDEKYLEKVTDFANKLKESGISQQKELEDTVKTVFRIECEKTGQMLEEYQKSLVEVSEKSMTKKEMQDFQKQLAEYTNAIQTITNRRYEEVLKAFEEKLFQMGSWQFNNYIRALSESSVKISDLEMFLGQVKLLEESMKRGLKTSYEEYQTIFAGYKAKVQEVNDETKEKLIGGLTDLFQQQYARMQQMLVQHMEAMEQYQKEQKDLVECVESIRELSGENHSRLKLLSRVVTDLQKQQEDMMEKINLATDAIEDNSRQMKDTLKLVKEESQQIQEGFLHLKKQKEELQQLAKQNEESIGQMQEMTRQVKLQILEVTQNMQEVTKKSEAQSKLLKALITETPGWKIDLFGRFEINLIYVMIILLAGILIKLMFGN